MRTPHESVPQMVARVLREANSEGDFLEFEDMVRRFDEEWENRGTPISSRSWYRLCDLKVKAQ